MGKILIALQIEEYENGLVNCHCDGGTTEAILTQEIATPSRACNDMLVD